MKLVSLAQQGCVLEINASSPSTLAELVIFCLIVFKYNFIVYASFIIYKYSYYNIPPLLFRGISQAASVKHLLVLSRELLIGLYCRGKRLTAIYIYMCVCVCVCVCLCVYLCMCVYVCVCMYVCVYIYILCILCIYTYMHTGIYIYIYIYIYINK